MTRSRSDPDSSDCHGIFLLDKPAGLSSHRATARVRGCFRRVRAGHGGTLDPSATGMLPIFLGNARRFAGYSLNNRKRYQSHIRLGVRSCTDDAEGALVATQVTRSPSLQALQSAIDQLCGEIEQRPPTYSAIQINGQRAWALARAGLPVALPTRTVQVYQLTIDRYHYPDVQLSVECSKGTYVRALARDLGEMLATGAVVTQLHRSMVGGFEGYPMHALSDLETGFAEGRAISDWLLTPDAGLRSLDAMVLSDRSIQLLYYGLAAPWPPAVDQPPTGEEHGSQSELWRVYDQRGVFYGLVSRGRSETGENQVVSVRLMPSSDRRQARQSAR